MSLGSRVSRKREKLYDRKVQRAFKRVAQKGRDTNFQSMTFGILCELLAAEPAIDLHTIGTLLGHKDMRMTKRYAHLNVESLRDAMSEKLEYHYNITTAGKTAGA